LHHSLDKRDIYIEQAFYGDIGKSHGCISSTFSNSELNSFLTAFTDRPGAIPAGIIMEPYLSGIRFDGKYIFTKTFPDLAAARGGMVFTHVLILEVNDLSYIKNLNDILSHFVSEIPNHTQLRTISITPTVAEKNERQEFPFYVQKTLQYIITDNLPVLFCGKLISFEQALCAIWPGLPLELKKNFSYTAGFSLSSLDYAKTIVYIQENLKPILKNSVYVDGLELHNVQIESEIEKFVLCKNAENVFEEFIKDLNIQLADWPNVKLAVKAFLLFQKIDLNISQDEIRLLVRNISKISPESSSGPQIKNKIIQKLADAISSDHNSNIKSLSNLDLKGFSEGANIIGKAIETFIYTAFNSDKNFQADAVDELLKLIDVSKINWWRDAVVKCFSRVCNKLGYVSGSNSWQIFLKAESSAVKLLSFIPGDNNAENIFIESMPKSIESLAAKKTAALIQDKNWFVLHAHLLLKYLPAKDAIKIQLGFERKSRSTNFEGSHLIIENLGNGDLLDAALATADDLLVNEYARRASIKPILLSDINAEQSVWLKIWSESIRITGNLAHGIQNLSFTLEKVVGLINRGIPIPEHILLHFSESEFSDLSDQTRENIWNNLPDAFMQKFLKATAAGCMDKILKGTLSFDNVEREITAILCSDDFITAFLGQNRSNINAVLTAYYTIPGLKDRHLSEYLYLYRDNINELESSKLGNIVFEKKLAISARQIFEKAKYNPQYRIALNNCKSLISFSWYEKLSYGSLFGEQVPIDAIYSEILRKAITMYPHGPEQNDIWKRAGGDISKFSNQSSREENWRHGFSLIVKGGSANLSASSLLNIMIEDHPQNNELKELKKHIK